MEKKKKNMENETQRLYDLEYGEKHSKTWKMRNAHCRNQNMEGKLKNLENETQTLFDLEYGEKQYKCGKLEMHTVGTGVWLEN